MTYRFNQHWIVVHGKRVRLLVSELDGRTIVIEDIYPIPSEKVGEKCN
jgi:hypothetical protein